MLNESRDTNTHLTKLLLLLYSVTTDRIVNSVESRARKPRTRGN